MPLKYNRAGMISAARRVMDRAPDSRYYSRAMSAGRAMRNHPYRTAAGAGVAFSMYSMLPGPPKGRSTATYGVPRRSSGGYA
jgi:hypothetical protein